MTISSIMTSAVSAINANGKKIAAAADNVANVNTDDYKAKEVRTTSLVVNNVSSGVQAQVLEQGQVDIGTEFTRMIMARTAYSLATKLIGTSEEMADQLIDSIA